MLTSGGSSGGESALIAACGSPLGVGTDIGGSLRIPAAMTGIFTIRPSYGRFPHFDARSGMAGQEAVGSVHGPMARSVADLKLFAQSVVEAGPWLKDPKCIEIPWRPVVLPERLKIAVLWHDGVVQPTPPVARALREVAKRLMARGHEVVEWDAKGHATATELLGKFFLADGGKSIRKILEEADEPFRPEMKAYETATELGVYELWQLQRQRTDLSKMYLDKWAASNGVDAILLPTTPYAALKNGDFKYVGYTGVYNILDYSAVSFPTGLHVDKELDVVPADFKPLSDLDETTAKDYDAAAVHGMPISLQLTGRRLQEEKILEVADRVVKDLVW
jgi:amidase